MAAPHQINPEEGKGLSQLAVPPQPSFYSESTSTMADQDQAGTPNGIADNNTRMSVEIHELARKLTTRSLSSPGCLFPSVAGGALDPNSDKFNARKWATAFYNSRKDASGTAPRTAGIAFKNLDVYGYGTDTDFQKTIGNMFVEGPAMLKKLLGRDKKRIDILQDLEGVVNNGEMLCVLGPPGSGCSTLLKTIAGDTYGFHVDNKSTINYQGIRPEQIRNEYRGEAIYTAEVDNHFAHLTAGDTLYFAARSRSPKHIPQGVSKAEYAEHLRDVIMAMFGISHTKNTRVGDDFVRGVSGGERKRITIAEAALGFSPLQCWDNSTRGLDSANAVEFCRTLRTQADITRCSSCVAIYQAPQAAYDVSTWPRSQFNEVTAANFCQLFDKVIVLYEGRQIFFGKADAAKAYFEDLGFVCPEQQTTADFLTSMTNHSERIVRPGWEGRTPRTADEFAKAWKASPARAALLHEIEVYVEQHPFDGVHHSQFSESRRLDQSKHQRERSPFNLSYVEQMNLCLWRSWGMLKSDPSITLTMFTASIFEGLIVSSVFYNLPSSTSSFFRRTLLLFFIMLINAFGSILEIMTLYAKRKVVEKHARYAFYHPSAEALAAMIVDLPYKIVNGVLLNTLLYFMCNLRREPGPYFFFLLFSLTITLVMSMMFRLIGSVTKTIAQALAPASVVLLALVLYCGFTIPVAYLQVWLGWLRWINPIHYGLESVFLNEFVGRRFPCSGFVPAGPGYENVGSMERVCSTVGSVPGENFVQGETYLQVSFGFVNSHRWRNFGVLIAFLVLFMGLHLFATEYVASERSKGEVLVFTKSSMKKNGAKKAADIESGIPETNRQAGANDTANVADIEKQTSIFHWKDVCYDVKIKTETRRILDHVDGWVKPGTLTALMVSNPSRLLPVLT